MTPPAFSLLLILASTIASVGPQMPRFEVKTVRASCPSGNEMPGCTCEEDNTGLNILCHGSDQAGIVRVRNTIKHHISSLGLYDLAPSLTHLPAWLFYNISLSNLAVVRSHIKDVDEDLFAGVEHSLISLTFQQSKLTYVPRGVNKITSLKSLDLRGNNISELYPYSFYGASIAQLSLADNSLLSLSENAFLGLEGNLKTLNLRGNIFQTFPMTAVRNLQSLEDLNLGM